MATIKERELDTDGNPMETLIDIKNGILFRLEIHLVISFLIL